MGERYKEKCLLGKLNIFFSPYKVLSTKNLKAKDISLSNLCIFLKQQCWTTINEPEITMLFICQCHEI